MGSFVVCEVECCWFLQFVLGSRVVPQHASGGSDFFWHSLEDSVSLHSVQWDLVCGKYNSAIHTPQFPNHYTAVLQYSLETHITAQYRMTNISSSGVSRKTTFKVMPSNAHQFSDSTTNSILSFILVTPIRVCATDSSRVAPTLRVVSKFLGKVVGKRNYKNFKQRGRLGCCLFLQRRRRAPVWWEAKYSRRN